jgi:hypothetical protein
MGWKCHRNIRIFLLTGRFELFNVFLLYTLFIPKVCAILSTRVLVISSHLT